MTNHELIHSAYERLAAIEIADGNHAELFFRGTDDLVSSQLVEFHPWLLTAGMELGSQLAGNCGVQALAGTGAMRARVEFPDVASYEAAVKQLKKLTGQNPSSPLAPYRVFSDLMQQAMIALQARLFHGMTFRELRRMQLDIECRTSVPGKFCDAKVEGDEVFMVALTDSTGFELCLTARECGGEAALLQRTLEAIQERDPDVIEGHNLFNFDLPYLETRCKRYKIPFTIGRHGRVAKSRASRFTIAEKTINYTRYDIYGRHVVDTYHLVRLADNTKREMDSYGLKYAAKYFGIAKPDRTYVEGNEITNLYETDLERLKRYNIDDVLETDGISRILSASYFYQTQLLPLSYQNCVIRGNATRIDGMLCAEYLAANAALPSPQAAVPFEGALTEASQVGVFQPVWHIDVRSLYPSVILAKRLSPTTDVRGTFLTILDNLRQFRLQAKDAARTASTAEERDYYSALQASFKILINSFYGYLGFAQGTFNDYVMAREVTATGREILGGMRDHLTAAGAAVVEMDTDGIYFVPPAGTTVDAMRQRIQQELPPGIEVELDGVFAAMFSYKSKNYALLEEDGHVILRGAALRSRSMEPFLRRYVDGAVERILLGRACEVAAFTAETEEAIREHRLPLADFLQRASLNQTVETYQEALKKGKSRQAVYELAARAKKRDYQPGDTLKYYVTGTRKKPSVADNSKLDEEIDPAVRDENVAYYLDRLKSLADNFLAALSQQAVQ
ncbi:MAG: ribonuclease H-like domain-containing protein [Victivallales bacterium]|nr:ribonuclease H-like domain-containing protein [Victivallales bacterium]